MSAITGDFGFFRARFLAKLATVLFSVSGNADTRQMSTFLGFFGHVISLLLIYESETWMRGPASASRNAKIKFAKKVRKEELWARTRPP
jgi:hypothetical protein